TAYCLLRSLVEHSCINPKSLAFGYLYEKLIDTALLAVALFTEVELPVAPDHSHDHVPLHGTPWYLDPYFASASESP
ncbi:hypothetical protein GW17_00006810, partial [Ensete ventricosum]